MGAKNKVIKGSFEGQPIFKEPFAKNLNIGGKKGIFKTNIKGYEIIDQLSTKSASSAILRSIVGVTMLGSVGLLAGISAKNKGIYLIAIEFNTKEQSLIEIDEKLYKIFITSMS